MKLPANWTKAMNALRGAGYRVETNVADGDLDRLFGRATKRTRLVGYSRSDRRMAEIGGKLGLSWTGSAMEIIGILSEAGIIANWYGQPGGLIYVDLRS